jgi:hypothetical protein
MSLSRIPQKPDQLPHLFNYKGAFPMVSISFLAIFAIY